MPVTWHAREALAHGAAAAPKRTLARRARDARLEDGEVAGADPAEVRVLVVDDELSIRRALTRYLSARGFEVRSAASADEALCELRQAPFSAMFCDVRMPGMSGVELVPHALEACPGLAITILSAVNDAPTAAEALSSGAYDYLMKPVALAELHEALLRSLERRGELLEKQRVDRRVRVEVLERTAELENEKAALRALSISTVETLVNAQEAKDRYLRGHSQRVADLAASVAKELGEAPELVRMVHLAGRLHDVGKIGIREEVLNKPARLTDDEFLHVQEHVRIGVEILRPLSSIIDGALDFVQDHHERWDGLGYPNGLVGEEICLGGRILAVADSFDALTSERAYRAPLSAREALDFLCTQSGTHLDPQVFAALTRVMRKLLGHQATGDQP